jgi:hypothetical protein
MTDEQKLAVLYDKADQLDREYEMAMAAYDIKGVWDFCRRCEENQQEIARINTARLRAENKRLTEIVERLPKTADGVAVVPGMDLYEARDIFGETEIRKVDSVATTTFPDVVIIEECYSTREAAEAAREGGGA